MSSFDHMIMNTASLVDAALAYARSGLPVFPLLPGEKRPMVAHGFYSATTNLALIRRWWRQRAQESSHPGSAGADAGVW